MDPLRDPPFPGRSSAARSENDYFHQCSRCDLILGMKKISGSPASDRDRGVQSARVPERFDSSTQGGHPAPTPAPAATLVPTLTNQAMGWLTIAEAAGLIRVPKSWLYERTRTNTIPHLKLGKYLRFDRDELVAWSRQFRRDGRGPGRQSLGPRDERRKNREAAALGL
jgi:excisionase family DNA binding protein